MFLVKVQYREALNLFDENRNHLEKSEDRTPVFIEVFPAWFIFFCIRDGQDYSMRQKSHHQSGFKSVSDKMFLL